MRQQICISILCSVLLNWPSGCCLAKKWVPSFNQQEQSAYKLLLSDRTLSEEILSETKRSLKPTKATQSFISELSQLQKDLRKVH